MLVLVVLTHVTDNGGNDTVPEALDEVVVGYPAPVREHQLTHRVQVELTGGSHTHHQS